MVSFLDWFQSFFEFSSAWIINFDIIVRILLCFDWIFDIYDIFTKKTLNKQKCNIRFEFIKLAGFEKKLRNLSLLIEIIQRVYKYQPEFLYLDFWKKFQ